MYTHISKETIDWLMSGDPSIRWQTMRDLLDEPEETWRAEQQRTLQTGWVAQLLAHQDPGGGWGGGIYSPKWISATYTLLTLCELGIPRGCAAAQKGARLVVDSFLGDSLGPKFLSTLARCDRCIVGMLLQLAVYFEIEDARVEAIVDNLLNVIMPDGAWNCRRDSRPKPHHSSFHTTFNVLDGLRNYVELFPGVRRAEVLAAEETAREWMLLHRLYKSHRSGEIINPRFTMLSFPHHWHYDVLRGLEYFARVGAPHDERLQDAIQLLRDKRREDGFWPVQQRYSGKVFFHMEKIGSPSRWNTLRALRVLRWWEA